MALFQNEHPFMAHNLSSFPDVQVCNSTGPLFATNRLLLSACSSFLHELFLSIDCYDEGQLSIIIPDINHNALQDLLHFGKIILETSQDDIDSCVKNLKDSFRSLCLDIPDDFWTITVQNTIKEDEIKSEVCEINDLIDDAVDQARTEAVRMLEILKQDFLV